MYCLSSGSLEVEPEARIWIPVTYGGGEHSGETYARVREAV